MSNFGNVHLAPEGDDDDLYSGFNDYNPSLNAEVHSAHLEPF